MSTVTINESEQAGAILNEAISIKDLIHGGATFEINSEFDRIDSDDLFPELETGAINDDEINTNEPILSPWEKSFDELRQIMYKLPEYNIYKKIIKPGHGYREMPAKSQVTIHYNAYWEGEAIAFDSTYMRGQPREFITGQQEVLEGLEIAVQTMKDGEEAQFIISHELLFGDMGCPPRIRPKATGLFVVHLLHFIETGSADAIETVDIEDRRNYVIIVPKIREVHMRGIAIFKQGHISNACRLFHTALNTLEGCRLSNEQEQHDQQQLIAQLYTNLAICYNKLNLPKKVCLMCNEINRISDIRKNCKALFQEGRALLKLNDFKRSRERLTQALQLEPNNEEIIKELRLLNEKKTNCEKTEKDIWKRAFTSNCNNINNNNQSVNIDENIRTVMQPFLDSFVKNEKQRHLPLPDGLNDTEISQVRALIKNMSIKLQMEEDNDQYHYKLVKQT